MTTGSISSTVSGSGTLASQDVKSVGIYSNLEVDEYYVSSGDSVDENTLPATVTRASLLSAMDGDSSSGSFSFSSMLGGSTR